MPKLGVLGTLVWDRVFAPPRADARAEPVAQWGGATYSLASFAAACPPGWEVVPLLKVGADLWGPALEMLRSLPGLRLGAGVQRVPEPNNRVDLHYQDEAHRLEVLRGGVPPWTAAELEPLLGGLDALCVNFLAGNELELPTAEWLRKAFSGPLYADLHSLLLGPAGSGAREPRALPDAERWLACWDMAQANEAEAALAAAGAGRAADRPLGWLAERVAGRRPLAVAVTRGAAGAVCLRAADAPADPLTWPAARDETRPGATVRRHELAARPLTGDPTGCGDVWGAGCFASLLGGLGWDGALRRAHALAEARLRCARVEELPAALRAAVGGSGGAQHDA